MQVIAPRATDAPRRRAIVVGTLVGAILLVGGLSIVYLTFGTSFITRFMPGARPETSQVLAGMIAWTFALIAPAAFIMAGLARLVIVFDSVSRAKPRTTRTTRAAAALSDDYTVMPRLRLPDGRLVRELVLGPFGVAVIEELPPAAASRRTNDLWEVRAKGGRWLPIENPLERSAADAERVRAWLAEGEHDFVVKAYAAVVDPSAALPRTPECAVITIEQIPDWLASLPAQRSLTADRREQVVARVREAR